MKLLFLTFLVYAVYGTARADLSIVDIDDPVPENNNAGLWNVLYAKLNILLNDTADLSESIAILKQRQDEQEYRVTTLVQNLMQDANRFMDAGLQKLKIKQDAEEDRVLNFVQSLTTDTKAFMINGLEELQKRQEDQEYRLNDMMQAFALNANQSLETSIVDIQKRLKDQETQVKNLMDTLTKDVKTYMDENLMDLKTRFDDQENRVTAAIQSIANEAQKSVDATLEEVMKGFHILEERQHQQHDLSLQILENTKTTAGSAPVVADINLDSRSLNYHRDWTTIVRRLDGSVSFDLTWDEYKKGFGNVNGEFFIGLEKLHALTTYGGPQELLVVLGDDKNQTRYAKYDVFQVGSESEEYAIIQLGTYSGDAGDSLSTHAGMKFVTKDKISDYWQDIRGGGWWRSPNSMCDLTSYYYPIDGLYGIFWATWGNWQNTLSYAEMMVRSKV
ncbi:uncharacterized protein LOC142229306 [Haematobia irritans]|uniref:uncharacterized protein LOC142229306 n=1 Tax=Haematobia irritans TaxID=7368 RepID=UPI003F4FD8F1